MEDLKQTISEYAGRDLATRKTWYSPAAEAYNRVRPRYPQALIERVIAFMSDAVRIAQLSTRSKILEIGCGAKFGRLHLMNDKKAGSTRRYTANGIGLNDALIA